MPENTQAKRIADDLVHRRDRSWRKVLAGLNYLRDAQQTVMDLQRNLDDCLVEYAETVAALERRRPRRTKRRP